MIRIIIFFLILTFIIWFLAEFNNILLYIKLVLLQDPVPKTKVLENNFIINKGETINSMEGFLKNLYLIGDDKLNKFLNWEINKIIIWNSLILNIGNPIKLQAYVLIRDQDWSIKINKKNITLDTYGNVIKVVYKKVTKHQWNARLYLNSILQNKIKYIDIITDKRYEFKYDINNLTDNDQKIIWKLINFLKLAQVFNY